MSYRTYFTVITSFAILGLVVGLLTPPPPSDRPNPQPIVKNI